MQQCVPLPIDKKGGSPVDADLVLPSLARKLEIIWSFHILRLYWLTSPDWIKSWWRCFLLLCPNGESRCQVSQLNLDCALNDQLSREVISLVTNLIKQTHDTIRNHTEVIDWWIGVLHVTCCFVCTYSLALNLILYSEMQKINWGL